jgi:O-antigen/teichoic acid export membrane protein
MWMTITSLATMLAFSDLGLGNGLLSKIANSSGREDKETAIRSVASAYYLLYGIALLILSAVGSLYYVLPWAHILRMNSPVGSREAAPAVAAFIFCFALNMPFGIVQKIQTGYQEMWVANLWLALGNLSALPMLLIAIKLTVGLPLLILFYSGTPLLVSAANQTIQFRFVRPWIAPHWHNYDWRISRSMLNTGMVFLVTQIANFVALYADNIIIDRMSGPSAVAIYSVGLRYFSVVFLVPQILFTSLWPAYSEAYARGDMGWVLMTLKRSSIIGLVTSVSTGVILAGIAPWFIALWTRGAVTLPYSLVIALCASGMVFAWSYSYNIFLWGVNEYRFVALSMVVVAATSLVAKVIMLPRYGLVGVAWSSTVCYLLFCALPNLIYSNYLCKRRLIS